MDTFSPRATRCLDWVADHCGPRLPKTSPAKCAISEFTKVTTRLQTLRFLQVADKQRFYIPCLKRFAGRRVATLIHGRGFWGVRPGRVPPYPLTPWPCWPIPLAIAARLPRCVGWSRWGFRLAVVGPALVGPLFGPCFTALSAFFRELLPGQCLRKLSLSQTLSGLDQAPMVAYSFPAEVQSIDGPGLRLVGYRQREGLLSTLHRLAHSTLPSDSK